MKRNQRVSLAVAHGALLVLVAVVLFAPKQRSSVEEPWPMLMALALMEGLFLLRYFRRAAAGACDIILFVWVLLLTWELATSVLNRAHPVLIPCPENVFQVFRKQWPQLLRNVLSSLELLAVGFTVGMVLAVALGLAAGWFPRLREFAYPIANVLAPIPPVVFSPYLVALMPGFRSASAVVIVLGVFWPAFLSTVNRVRSVDPRVLDSARMLNLGSGAMIGRVLLPCILPGIVSGLKVSLTTSLLMLNFAELMGAAHGMGYYVQNAIAYANYTHAVAGILCIGLVVTVLSCLVSLVQKKTIRWR